MVKNLVEEEKNHYSNSGGIIAIDLGSTTTVVAFQGPGATTPELLDLKPLNNQPGLIPSLVWDDPEQVLIGNQVIEFGLEDCDDPRLISDFKRRIGSEEDHKASKAGKLLLQSIWKCLPKNLSLRRLVLTAPVESYHSYRRWLKETCKSFPVEEIALVDEPTAAALGAGLNPGNRMLVVDLGGSTLDLSLVALEGGEGRAAPIAQLVRLGDRDLTEQSRQHLRIAKVLGKSGLRIGGRDIDRWIVDYCYPDIPITSGLLNAAERLKCRLSDTQIPAQSQLLELCGEKTKTELRLSRYDLNILIEQRGLGKAFQKLLDECLTGGRQNGCDLHDLDGVVAVGGGSHLPWLRSWLKKHTVPAPLLTPSPVEAVVVGALKLTPGVTIRDVLRYGVSLRVWDQRAKCHSWHPLFVSGQPWPSPASLELVMAASRDRQEHIELVLGEPSHEGRNEVFYVNGMPTIRQRDISEQSHRPWHCAAVLLPLTPPGTAGEDCLRLLLSIDSYSQLRVQVTDLRSGEVLPEQILGTVH